MATPMLATSCGEDKKEVTTIDRPTPTDQKINASTEAFDAWQTKIQKSENFASDITTFFGDKAGGVTKDNISAIKVELATDQSGLSGGDKRVKVTLTLKDNIEFKKTDGADQSKTLDFTVTVTLHQ